MARADIAQQLVPQDKQVNSNGGVDRRWIALAVIVQRISCNWSCSIVGNREASPLPTMKRISISARKACSG